MHCYHGAERPQRRNTSKVEVMSGARTENAKTWLRQLVASSENRNKWARALFVGVTGNVACLLLAWIGPKQILPNPVFYAAMALTALLILSVWSPDRMSEIELRRWGRIVSAGVALAFLAIWHGRSVLLGLTPMGASLVSSDPLFISAVTAELLLTAVVFAICLVEVKRVGCEDELRNYRPPTFGWHIGGDGDRRIIHEPVGILFPDKRKRTRPLPVALLGSIVLIYLLVSVVNVALAAVGLGDPQVGIAREPEPLLIGVIALSAVIPPALIILPNLKLEGYAIAYGVNPTYVHREGLPAD